jgi:hypothetical protein
VIAGIAVFDRQTGTFLAQVNETRRFRSASLVKIFIAIDFLWDRTSLSSEDQHQLEIMLRGSDDKAASYFYAEVGGEPALNRVFSRLSLQDTKPPSAVGLKGWGSTTLSANDMVRTYQFLLTSAPPFVRDQIMGHLHASTPCGTDEYFQSFGIPSTFTKPWSAKQGWWGFGDKPSDLCTGPLPVPPGADGFTGGAPALMDGRVLHSTGTAGNGDRLIVAVLTQYPNGANFMAATAAITTITRSLPRPPGVN